MKAAFLILGLCLAARGVAAQDMQGMDSEMGDQVFAHLLFDQFEARPGGGTGDFRWDGQGWIGGDYDKLWIRSEGLVKGDGRVEDGDHELLYDRAVSTYFDLQAGLRSDLDSRTTRNWAAFGVQGLAPQFFDVAATAYVGESGRLAARFQASYDLLLTQRLILQPEVELNLYSRTDPSRGIGAGLSDIDAGLRLRYEVTRKFAPYLGLAYSGRFTGEKAGDVRLVFGIRNWF